MPPGVKCRVPRGGSYGWLIGAGGVVPAALETEFPRASSFGPPGTVGSTPAAAAAEMARADSFGPLVLLDGETVALEPLESFDVRAITPATTAPTTSAVAMSVMSMCER